MRETVPNDMQAGDALIEEFALAMATPDRPERVREGSAASPEMLYVFAGDASKEEVRGHPSLGWGVRVVRTRLFVEAWVNGVPDTKVWADVYLLDGEGEVVHAETFTLDHLGRAGSGGTLFDLDVALPSPGSGSPMTPPALLGYRLYCAAGERLYTDGVLHEHLLGPGTGLPKG